MKKLLFALALLCLASTAIAQTTVPPWSFDRVAFGLAVGTPVYEQAQKEMLGDQYGFMPSAHMSYSCGRAVSLNAVGLANFTSDYEVFKVGPRVMVIGSGQGDHVQFAFGANLLWYMGTNAAVIAPINKNAGNAGLYFSYNLAGAPGKALRWYVTANGENDWINDVTTFYTALHLTYTSPWR